MQSDNFHQSEITVMITTMKMSDYYVPGIVLNPLLALKHFDHAQLGCGLYFCHFLIAEEATVGQGG